MKDKILTFIIGLLVGAIISALGCYFYFKNNTNSNNNNNFEMRGGPGMMQNGDMDNETFGGMRRGKPGDTTFNSSDENMEEPPEMPSGEAPSGEIDNKQNMNNNGERLEMPERNNQSSQNTNS